MHYTYRVIIEPDEQGFHGYVPALRGCHTWGRTIPETEAHLQEAIAVYLESLHAHGEVIPRDQGFESFASVELRRPRRTHVRARRVVRRRQYV